MIRFAPPPEPPDFDETVRQPGNVWLREHPGEKRPRDLWSDFRSHLADGFRDLCAYSVMCDRIGTVDHYLSYRNHPELAYEWSNYRYASGWINQSKRTEDEKVLDPFEVQDGWFEILLPSLQLVMTDQTPPEERERAQYTLKRLHLRDDERVIRQRRAWYEMYEEGKLSLDGLEDVAPLIARAVRKQLNSALFDRFVPRRRR